MVKLASIIFIFLGLVNYTLAQPADAIKSAYHAYFTEKDWRKSIELFATLAQQNPTHADYTVRLAFALQNEGRLKESITAFQNALTIGPWPDIYHYQIAVCYANLNDANNAIKHLKLALEHGWPRYIELEKDKNFATFRDSKPFQQLLGRSDADASNRVTRWEADLNFLVARLQHLHYDMYNTNPKEVWEQEIKTIRKNLRTLSDQQIIVSFMKLAALAGEGHTKVLPPENGPNAFHAMPLTLYHFSNGCFIVKADPQHRELIGKKVIRIGSREIEDLVKQSRKYAGHENDMHHKKINPRFLVMSETLLDMKAIQSVHEVVIGTANQNGTTRYDTIQTKTLQEIKDQQSSWIDLAPEKELPLYLTNKQRDWWYTSIPEKQLLYLNIRYIVNEDKLRFSQFVDSTFKILDRAGIKGLVLDLRNCGGGNSALNRFLIQEILTRPELNKEENFRVIIGRNTYSAAQNLVSDIEYRLNATFIGEPTGSRPNFIGESNQLKLPFSQLNLVISNRYHQGGANNSLDKRPWISPSVLIEMNSDDYARNQDPVMNYILSEH